MYMSFIKCILLTIMYIYIPVSKDDFKWLSYSEIKTFDLSKIQRDAARGYILEVDLDYPEQIHDQYEDYPLAPEKMSVKYDMLSPYQKEILRKAIKDCEKYQSVEKHIINLKSKKNYIVHYRNLQLYLSLGMTLVKVHKILSFNQSPWLSEYRLQHT